MRRSTKVLYLFIIASSLLPAVGASGFLDLAPAPRKFQLQAE
jgi:hypothetical protein